MQKSVTDARALGCENFWRARFRSKFSFEFDRILWMGLCLVNGAKTRSSSNEWTDRRRESSLARAYYKPSRTARSARGKSARGTAWLWRTADGARDGNRKSIFVPRTDLEAFVVHASALRKSLLTFWLSLARSRAKLRTRIVVISPHIEFCNAMTFFYIDRSDCEKFF